MRLFLLWFPLFFVGFSGRGKAPLNRYQLHGAAQGTSYHITYFARNSIVTKSQVDSLLNQIDSSLSLYKTYSLVNRFNQSADGLVPDRHLAVVISKAQDIHRVTKGLFDITVYPLTDAWGFGPKRKDSVPGEHFIRRLLPCVNSDLLSWDGEKLMKKKSCVQLDPNGIAQGYSVDVIAAYIEQRGCRNYIVELGGEIRVRGKKPGKEKMSIGIEAPGEESDFSMIEKIIYPVKGAITTSGNYRRYYESQGRKISHLLDPRTGYPVANELISVTVYAKDAMTADGYDNAIMAMGLEQGLSFVERHKELAAYFIYHKPGGVIADTMSKRFRRLLKP